MPNGDDTGRPILVLSNRLPFTVERRARGLEKRHSAGGLVAALEPALCARGGTWVGWPGAELRPGEHLSSGGKAYRITPVHLTENDIQRYYHGFSNRTLWPLLHSFPALTRFDQRDFISYERVNDRFAETALAESKDTDLVWVHDYHLMLAPRLIRQGRPDVRLGFFLHVPFPPYDIFRLLPWDRQLLRGMLACDLIGFHVHGYARNFIDCVERRLGARVDHENLLVEHGDRTIQVGAFPIGIDFERFESLASAAPARVGRRERVVLGVDRLDYTKGIPHRIRAFERLLELHPRHRENVVLLQLAVPSRAQVEEYRELKREIDELVGRVNGRFATATWSPIRYLYRTLTPDRLAALYRDADVALITPLRDGMNLVAKEYVACQVGEPGVLVLSQLAGAAETMREAILVNPYDVDGTAEALHRALTMDEAERRSRMAALRRRERRDDVSTWTRSFLEAAASAHAALRPPSDEEFNAWLGRYLSRHRLALFLDYDGTLVPLCEHPRDAVLSDEVRETLRLLAARPDTDVAIVSGRSQTDIRQMVGLPELIYAGNHGLEIVGADVPEFKHQDLVHYQGRTAELAEKLRALATEGAWVEEKGHTLTFHVRAVPEPRRRVVAEQARAIINDFGFQARDAHAAIEARPPIGWDKGRAVLHVLRERYGVAWSETVRVVYCGDDETDEDAFRLLAGLAVTFRVGSADTMSAATRRLPNVEAVHALLRWLARRPAPEL